MKLYEISDEIRTLLDAVDPETGEMTEEQFTALNDLEMAFADKAESVAFVIRESEAHAAAIKAEADRLAKSARSKNNTAERLKAYLLFELTNRDIPKISGKVLSIRRQFSSPAVVIERPDIIPTEYKIVSEPTISKTLIKDALKDGVDVPGAKLVRNEHVRII